MALKQTDLFSSRLPYNPYCTDDLARGLMIRNKASAIQRRYIQHNPPPLLAHMVYDLDRPESASAWEDAYLPPPTWVAVNPENGHCHIAYGLIAPVARTDIALAAPLRLAAAIEFAYCMALGADRSYSGLITKNPLHPHWRVFSPAGNAANQGYYELGYLAEFVDLPKKIPSRKDATGSGRNVSLFNDLRLWSYRAVRNHWRPNGFKAWQSAVIEKAESLNQFSEPLPHAELKATANSISKWTWRQFTPASFREYVERTHASEIQSARGRLGGIAKGKANDGKRVKAKELKESGMSYQKIADTLNVSRRSVINWCK
jgi:hypothetical protein